MDKSNLKNPVLGLCFIAVIVSFPIDSSSGAEKEAGNPLETDIQATVTAMNACTNDTCKRDVLCKKPKGFFRKSWGGNCKYIKLAHLGNAVCEKYTDFKDSWCAKKIKAFKKKTTGDRTREFISTEIEKKLSNKELSKIPLFTKENLDDISKAISQNATFKDIKKLLKGRLFAHLSPQHTERQKILDSIEAGVNINQKIINSTEAIKNSFLDLLFNDGNLTYVDKGLYENFQKNVINLAI